MNICLFTTVMTFIIVSSTKLHTYTVMFVYCTVQFRGILDFSSLDLIPVNCVLFIRNSLYVHVLLIIKENCFENFSCSALSRTALNILPDSFG